MECKCVNEQIASVFFNLTCAEFKRIKRYVKLFFPQTIIITNFH